MTDVLSKIKKLLALSKSPNPNEAASALAMAQDLMERFGIDQEAVSDIGITEEVVFRHGGGKPPLYEAYLMAAIAEAFGCRSMHSGSWKHLKLEYTWVFIGLEHRSQVAAFIGTVLLRKLRTSRSEYLRTLYRVRSRSTKTKRADEYCNGWTSVAVQKVKGFVLSTEEKAEIDLYMKRYDHAKGKLETIRRNAPSRYVAKDYYAGHDAASGLELQHGVNGNNPVQYLEEGA